ncbi:NADH:ubiquinone reductase (H(+)-translocating) [Handroanthus impetiginosus]|uniref:NADH:ubiquinone reductase (H(+)-translocating) n=1 Tax=Handroanthus impetiginosus TaxID=429701 RepID=A0A2G9HWF9_9LAMI|nr:NADH:ubiquinone reductase (H(+)-translocating) [Handroanthus impetiginosus]
MAGVIQVWPNQDEMGWTFRDRNKTTTWDGNGSAHMHHLMKALQSSRLLEVCVVLPPYPMLSHKQHLEKNERATCKETCTYGFCGDPGPHNLNEIVMGQKQKWFSVPLFFVLFMFFISHLVETNRALFDIP